MKSFARSLIAPSLAVLLAFLLLAVALERASASYVESVEDAIAAAIELYRTDPEQAKDDLYALAVDDGIPESCAMWADINLSALLLIEDAMEFPDSWAVQTLFGWTLQAIPIAKNDCILAL